MPQPAPQILYRLVFIIGASVIVATAFVRCGSEKKKKPASDEPGDPTEYSTVVLPADWDGLADQETTWKVENQ